MSAPEFSRPEWIDTIGEASRDIAIAADATERAALAERFDVPSIDRLEARFSVQRDAAGFVARGHVSADVTQACIVTGEALDVTVEENVALRFVQERGAGEEIELSEDACDTIPFEGGAIDLGEAAAETMALALDPFPRGPRAEAALREAGVISEDEVQPSGAFADLKARLIGKG